MAGRATRCVITLVVLATAGCADDQATPEVAPVEETTAPRNGPPAAEILDRTGQHVAWTDAGLFVYGGQTGEFDNVGGAALVDPATAEVTPLPEPPFEAPLDSFGVTASVGPDLLLIGVPCSGRVDVDADTSVCEPGGVAAAVYSLDDEAWRSIELPDELVEQVSPDPEQSIHLLGVTSDGRVVIEPTQGQPLEPGTATYWTYRPADDEWQHLDPVEQRVEQSCLSGDRLVVSSSRLEEDESSIELELGVLDLAADDGWTVSPSLTAMIWWPALRCAEGVALVHSNSYDQGTYRFPLDGGGSWEALPSLPDEVGFARTIPVGDRIVFANRDRPGAGVVLDPAAFTWESFDLGAWRWPTLPVWTGEELVVLTRFGTGISTVELPER